MSDAPERIWAWARGNRWDVGGHCTTEEHYVTDGDTEYVRADLYDPLRDERVRALVDAARPFAAAVFDDNGDVTISQGNITRRHWLALDAALRAIKEPKPR